MWVRTLARAQMTHVPTTLTTTSVPVLLQESQEDLYADESPCRRSSAEPRGVQQHQPSSSYYSSQQQQHADGPAPSDRTDRHHHRGRAVASTYSAQHAPQQRDEPGECTSRAGRQAGSGHDV